MLQFIIKWTPRNKFQWNLKGNTFSFIHKNVFENIVCQNGSHVCLNPDAMLFLVVLLGKGTAFFQVFPFGNVPFLACFQYYAKCCIKVVCNRKYRADSRLAPRQWETLLQSNTTSHWLGTNLESTLKIHYVQYIPTNIQIAHDDLMTFSALLALCVGNPLVILACRASNGECW